MHLRRLSDAFRTPFERLSYAFGMGIRIHTVRSALLKHCLGVPRVRPVWMTRGGEVPPEKLLHFMINAAAAYRIVWKLPQP